MDLFGGEKGQYVDRPSELASLALVKEEVPLVDKAVPAEVGKVIEQTEKQRTIALVSGTTRTDYK